LVRTHDVAGLDVAVDDALVVGRLERVEHVNTDASCVLGLEWSLRPDRFRERGSLDELHDDVGRALLIDDVEDRDDVRVAELGGGARLARGARLYGLALGHRNRGGQLDLFDCDLALQQCVVGHPHNTHAPLAEGVTECVASGHLSLADIFLRHPTSVTQLLGT